MSGVMDGVRILEVAEHTFVPAASAVLSDWGAEVIKVEHVTRGDAMRGLASTGVVDIGSVHVLLEHSNRGKKSIGLDLTTDEGREIVYKLAALSDVFLTNKLPDVRTKLRMDVDDIRAHNPSIIYVQGSGYGSRGPHVDKGGYDILGFWARSGLAVATTPLEVDHLVSQPGAAFGDCIGAMTIAGGISAALFHREKTGEAKVVDVSLLGTAIWAAGAGIALSLDSGIPMQPPPADRTNIRNPLANSYKTKDDRWIYLSCLQYFHYWPEACRVLGRPDLVDDPRFATFEALTDNAYEASKILQAEFASRTLEEWKERLDDFKGQWSPVQHTVELPDDPMVQANGYLLDVQTADGTPFTLVATPVQFDGAPAPANRSPEFNEHGDEILTGLLGMDMDAVIDLKIKGAVA